MPANTIEPWTGLPARSGRTRSRIISASLGIALQAQGRHDEALNVFDKAVQLRPDDAGLWKHLGDALMELQRPADALLSLQHASKLDPRDCDAAYKSLFLLHNLGRFEEALAQFDRCDELQPDHVPALQCARFRCVAWGGSRKRLTDNRRAHRARPGQCRNLQQYRRRAAVAWPAARGVAMVRPRARAAAGLDPGAEEQGFRADAVSPVRRGRCRLSTHPWRSIQRTLPPNAIWRSFIC